MTQVDYYKLPWKDKDATTVNDTAYTFLNSYDDKISDSDKMVEASKEPITDTRFITHQLEPLVSIQSSLESESLDEGDVASLKA